jgi:hypothetical protein
MAGLLMSPFATAASAADKAIDAYARDEMVKRHIPGMALAVIHHARIEKMATYGYGNAEFSVPVRRDTLFTIASIMKEFTSVGLMLLVEAGCWIGRFSAEAVWMNCGRQRGSMTGLLWTFMGWAGGLPCNPHIPPSEETVAVARHSSCIPRMT